MSEQTKYQKGRQALFNLMAETHDATCMDSELDEIECCVLSYAAPVAAASNHTLLAAAEDLYQAGYDAAENGWDRDPSECDEWRLLVELLPASAAASDVVAERRRQIVEERRPPLEDDQYVGCELLRAALTYGAHTALMIAGEPDEGVPEVWPWAPRWWKPTTPRRNLLKAAALIIAEIERLDRQEARND